MLKRRGLKSTASTPQEVKKEADIRNLRILDLLDNLQVVSAFCYKMFIDESGFVSGVHQLSFIDAITVMVAMGIVKGSQVIEFG